MSTRGRAGGALCAVLCAAAGCALERTGPPVPPPGSEPFIVTFWCGPPLAQLDDDRAAEIAAAGFTVVAPPCEGGWSSDGNRRALDVALRHGLRMWIADPRFGGRAPEQRGWKERLATAVAEYGDHPALAGYFVEDEPIATRFEAIGSVVAELRAADPDRLAYVNLLPEYVTPEGLGVDSYAEYIERFVSEVRPRLLSYDYYPFGQERDRSTFFSSLTTVRAIAARHRVPFLLIVLAMPHGPYRDPSEAELRWQVFHALAFGARGISYFTYWTPTEGTMDDRYGLIENGRRTLHYFQVARINARVRAIAAQLAPFRSLAVADSIGEVGIAFPIGPIEAIEGGAVTAGLFTDAAGRLAVLLVNRDYRYGATVRLRLRPGAGHPEIFVATTNAWLSDGDDRLTIAPGDARLLRWTASGAPCAGRP